MTQQPPQNRRSEAGADTRLVAYSKPDVWGIGARLPPQHCNRWKSRFYHQRS